MPQINFQNDYSEHRTRQRLIEAAVGRLACQELDAELFSQVIEQVGCSKTRAEAFFSSSEDLVLALYARFASDMEARIMDLPDGTLAERFYALMQIKFALMTPYAQALGGLAKTLSNHHGSLGVLSPQTETIRIRVRGVLSATVQGATDYRGSSADSLSRNLYTTYLGLMWLWYQDKSEEKQNSQAALSIVRKTLSLTAPFLTLPGFELPLKGFDKIQQALLMPKEDLVNVESSTNILRCLFKHRRMLPQIGLCAETPCEQCFALHLPKVKYFVQTNRPIHLLLPAFPAKSPNRRKTLGILPDKAEEQALIYLEQVCGGICEMYAPGVRLTICSDGHVFSDLVGVSDTEVTLYGNDIRALINRLNSTNVIDTFSLPDLYEDIDYPKMREHLIAEYAQPLEEIHKRASQFPQSAALVNGIHRFLFEDQIDLQPERSRTKIRNECRALAYKVVQRSDAWGRLLADCFPMALRLSIHPQHPHSDKIGILLGPADDVWLTPWHGVAVKQQGNFKLMRRHEAESLGAELVEYAGRPSHYQLEIEA